MFFVGKSVLIFLFFGILLFPEESFGAETSWKMAKTKNFRLIGNASERNFRETAQKLENFRLNFFRLFSLNETASRVPENILVFNAESDCRNYFSDEKKKVSLNSLVEGEDANYFLICPNDIQKADLRGIYHDYFHYLLKNQVGKTKIPAWLNEGLAKLSENFDEADSLENASKNFDETAASYVLQNKLLPRDLFLENDYYALGQQEKHDIGVFAAQSAAFVAFLINEKGAADFQNFLKLLSAGTPTNEAIAKIFQTDYSKIEKNLKTFVEKSLAAKDVKTKELPPPSIALEFQKITDAEFDAFLGDFFYQAKDWRAAELYLLKSLAVNPSDAFAQSTFGVVKARQFDFAESFDILEKSLSSKNVNYLNYYRYAFALSRQGMTEYNFVSNYETQTAEKIRGLLRESIALNPNFAESYSLFALISSVRNDELDEALKFIENALASAPENEWYLLRKSEVEMRKENFPAARRNAGNVYRTASSAGIRLYAQNTLQRIDSTELQLMRARRDDNLPYRDLISEKPFTDEEIARLRAKAMLESLNAVLRRPAPDEERIIGNVVGIECRRSEVNFTVKSATNLLKLRTDSFESLRLTNYNEGAGKTTIGCGTPDALNTAVIIFRKLPKNSAFAGEVLSIEFVPKNFTLLSEN